MKNKAKAMVLASFVADSLALGAHWIYDTAIIRERWGRVDTLLKPLPDSFHPTKDAGEFTHYGDQAFVLLESVAALGTFRADDFSERWKALFQDYRGYYDKASKGTLENLSSGASPEKAGSSSSELAGASRVAPLVYCFQDDLDALLEAARAQTMMTHNHPLVIDAGLFFSTVSWMVLRGEDPVSAMQEVSRDRFARTPIANWVSDGIQSQEADSIETISGFGQSCHIDNAFPGVVHLISKYKTDLEEALVQSVMAGGDSAARGMAAGMVLGAHLGHEGIPSRWLSGLKKRQEVLQLLDRITRERSK